MQMSAKEKKVVVAAVLAVTIVLFYSLSVTATGFITTYTIEKKLNEKEQELNKTLVNLEQAQKSLSDAETGIMNSNKEKEACQSSLSGTNQQLSDCNDSISSVNKALSECTSAKTLCEADIASYKLNYEAATADYNSLASSSAAAICCSFSDFQSGTIRQWSIESNKLVCNSGNYTVNCKTGETSI